MEPLLPKEALSEGVDNLALVLRTLQYYFPVLKSSNYIGTVYALVVIEMNFERLP